MPKKNAIKNTLDVKELPLNSKGGERAEEDKNMNLNSVIPINFSCGSDQSGQTFFQSPALTLVEKLRDSWPIYALAA